ncbi:MAG: hypothetical protein HN945_16965 [Deltaproteobacteria bacterium]|jgi:hypothetical protein|nr:hypothetical protein [Deltaproteobacteria bacterium]MBT4643058.1 hypothetical protein [Deltaproteobacteria bacterium]MBT7154131.1 hypothetical protein [Deltaproteobacteria bacterium]MBT7711131.1 hypothetical protein [Deltaproteobacteria bacterium]
MSKQYSVSLGREVAFKVQRLSYETSKSLSKTLSGLIYEGMRIKNIRYATEQFFFSHTEEERRGSTRSFRIKLNRLLFDYDTENDREITENLDKTELLTEDFVQQISVLVEYLLDYVLPESGIIEPAPQENHRESSESD